MPELKEILAETLGVIVYQEQVMQIANRLAGYSLGEADLLRRAMGKKKAEEMAQQRERFVQGATHRGFPTRKIEKINARISKLDEDQQRIFHQLQLQLPERLDPIQIQKCRCRLCCSLN